MKSKPLKRKEALDRMVVSEYKNSKAYRTGSATKEQWEAKKQAELNK